MKTKLINRQVDKLEAGVVIARDTVVANGRIVIKAGTPLDDEYIKILQKEDIKQIVIEETEEPVVKKTFSAEELAELKSSIENRKKLMFRDCVGNSHMQQLYKIVCDLELEETVNG